MTLQLYLHTAALLFFLSLNVFGRVHNGWSKIIVCCMVLACDSELGSAKFYRLRPERATPTNSNSGLDSDSAALAFRLKMINKIWICDNFAIFEASLTGKRYRVFTKVRHLAYIVNISAVISPAALEIISLERSDIFCSDWP